jgi:hypothetical protein
MSNDKFAGYGEDESDSDQNDDGNLAGDSIAG